MLHSLSKAVAIALAVLWAGSAAAQPSSCAARFIGSWMVTVTATGQTYPAVIAPGGTAQSMCPFCTSPGTWRCSGNQIFITVNGRTDSYTLSADNRTSSGACCTAVRTGPAPSVASVQTPRQAAPQQSSGASRWLPPGSRNADPPPAAPPRNPFGGDIHMGNRPVTDPGPRVVQPAAQGLSEQRRRDIARLRGDRRALERYLNRLPARERQAARNYASTVTGGAEGQGLSTPVQTPGGGGDCAVDPFTQRLARQQGRNLSLCPRTVISLGGDAADPACRFQHGRGCNEETCTFHLAVLRNWGPPRLSSAQILRGMRDVGCGRWAPRG